MSNETRNKETTGEQLDELQQLGLSIRAANALRVGGLSTCSEVLSLGVPGLERLPGVGRVTAKEILKAARKMSLHDGNIPKPDNRTREKNNAKKAAYAFNDVSILGGIIGLLESNNLRTATAQQAQQRIIEVCQSSIRKIMSNHDEDMRKIGI